MGFFATGFFATGFFATGFFATGFFATGFFATGFLATGFFATGFLAAFLTAFLTTFLTGLATFFGAAFLLPPNCHSDDSSKAIFASVVLMMAHHDESLRASPTHSELGRNRCNGREGRAQSDHANENEHARHPCVTGTSRCPVRCFPQVRGVR